MDALPFIDTPSPAAETSNDDATTVAIEACFLPYAPAAVTRLGYLYPDVLFTIVDSGVRIHGGPDTVSMRREVLHALYRERILERTLPLRRTLIDGLLR